MTPNLALNLASGFTCILFNCMGILCSPTNKLIIPIRYISRLLTHVCFGPETYMRLRCAPCAKTSLLSTYRYLRTSTRTNVCTLFATTDTLSVRSNQISGREFRGVQVLSRLFESPRALVHTKSRSCACMNLTTVTIYRRLRRSRQNIRGADMTTDYFSDGSFEKKEFASFPQKLTIRASGCLF